MKTIWFCGDNEEKLTTIAEIVGEEFINRDQNVELIVHSEVQEILGRGLKDTKEDKSIFIDRLGFLGNLLHRNNIFALVVSKDASLADRRLVKENYKNYIQINYENKDDLCNIFLDNIDPKSNTKKIIDYLTNQKLIPQNSHSVYSKDEEEEIRRRLEELGYI